MTVLKRPAAFLLALLLMLTVTGCAKEPPSQSSVVTLETIPAYTGNPFVVLYNNEPSFTDEEKEALTSFETYTPLDHLGRCGEAIACIGQDIMPTEDRGSIGSVKPSGWQTVKYDIVDGKYLYNRCHLIGFQLTGENANELNLITGTRYINTDGMLPFENMIADYVRETDNHVILRVTPIFEGDNLVASGVQMEAYSVEDDGEGVCFNVYCYNIQPGIVINYADGTSHLAGTTAAQVSSEEEYVLNISSKKIHYPDCGPVDSIKENNRQTYIGVIDDLLAQDYQTCGSCFKE